MADDVREVLRSFILSTLLELVSFIEHAFSVTLQPDDMDRLDSVDLMADLIQQRRQGN